MRSGPAKVGDYNVICDVCGFKLRRSRARLRWDNLLVCPDDWEVRHPQDFLASRPERNRVHDARPRPTDVFITTNRDPDDL